MRLSSEMVERFIGGAVRHLGCGDFLGSIDFPEERNDVCVVRYSSEDGFSNGFDTIWVVWIDQEGIVRGAKIVDTSISKDYVHVLGVLGSTDEPEHILVQLSCGGSYSGEPWGIVYDARLSEVGNSCISPRLSLERMIQMRRDDNWPSDL